MTEKFSFDTIQNFDSHILASIPNYDVLFNSLLILSDYFVKENKIVYDVGCSTGKLLISLDKKYKDINCEFVGLDKSLNLLPKDSTMRCRFVETDLNQPFSFWDASLVFSIFTLQFLDKDSREQVLKSIYDGLNIGGALIITEKVHAPDGISQDIFTSSYYDFKKQYFTEKQILDKEVDLRKILKSNTTKDNIDLLSRVGFKKIYFFWKYFNFEGYIAIK